jgi:2-C-methyl-D-erythritol 4-phosphate cytidylyltransferase
MNIAIILAGGRGTRLENHYLNNSLKLRKMVVEHAVDAFEKK